MFNHFLLPVDDYTLEHADFARLSALAKRDSAKITLTHVSDPLPPTFYLQNGFGGDYITIPDHRRACESYATKMFRSVTERLAQGITIDNLHVFNGDVSEGILEAAKKSAADVILMTSHKRSGIGALLMGSETREVMAESRLPVLVL
ncbi:MAG: universal stress protein [Burkholderiaceae bacterium]|nr:universal stress protein [Burkholderiaceae bacterium]